MLSERKRKLITALQQKKYRLKHRLFVLEGEKIILDALAQSASNEIRLSEIFCTEGWLRRHRIDPAAAGCSIHQISEQDVARLSSLVTPQEVIGLASLPEYVFDPNLPADQLVLALDGIRDPGNLGTIIRTADWFGIRHIFCSSDTVDAYNTKVVQSTMGAILRVRVYLGNLEALLDGFGDKAFRVFGLTLGGENIFSSVIAAPGVRTAGILIAGNESRGIRPSILKRINTQITIPRDSSSSSGSESLNVASAVAIACAEIKRQEIQVDYSK